MGLLGLGGLYLANYLDKKDREDRIEMARTCSDKQLVPLGGKIECVPFADATKWSDDIGESDVKLLQEAAVPRQCLSHADYLKVRFDYEI